MVVTVAVTVVVVLEVVTVVVVFEVVAEVLCGCSLQLDLRL